MARTLVCSLSMPLRRFCSIVSIDSPTFEEGPRIEPSSSTAAICGIAPQTNAIKPSAQYSNRKPRTVLTLEFLLNTRRSLRGVRGPQLPEVQVNDRTPPMAVGRPSNPIPARSPKSPDYILYSRYNSLKILRLIITPRAAAMTERPPRLALRATTTKWTTRPRAATARKRMVRNQAPPTQMIRVR